MVTSISASLLQSLYGSQTGTASSLASTAVAKKKVAPTAPWSKIPTPQEVSADVKATLNGKKLIDENAAQLDLPGASADYRKLFALYKGLSSLQGLAEEMQKKGISAGDKKRIQAVFDKGYAEAMAYVKSADFKQLRLTTGEVAATVKTTAPVPATKLDYITGVLHAGTSSDAVARFQGNVQFTINVNRSGVDHTVNIDLNDMGSDVRSMANVVNFINGKLAAEGVDTRLATVRTPGAERTVVSGGKTISLGPGPDQWALKVVPNGEIVSFDAASTAPAVYMSQSVGNPNPDGNVNTNDSRQVQQIAKFQTDTSTVEAPAQGENEANWVDGRVFAKTLGPEVKAVRQTQVGPDGSVYMLADVTSKTAGQDIRGTTDVALMKYDSAGGLIFSRTLGASDNATGLALAVSDSGDVAVAGSVSGGLVGATEGSLNSGVAGTYANQADSFVTVYNSSGEEQWTQRRGAREADEASQLAFGADGTVYVAGRTKSALQGANAIGDWDSYVEAFGPPNAQGVVTPKFTQIFGTSGSDRPAGMVVDGTSLVTASVEGGRAILRRFDISGGTPVQTSTRDLGDLQGGDIAGLALDGTSVVIAGSTGNGALSAGTVRRAYSGGIDAFAARIPASLGGGGDVSYYGGAGDDRATAMTVSNGDVWIAGSAGTDLPGEAAVGTKDGFLTKLNVATGGIDWSRRFTGKDGYAAPESIAVDPFGATSLDRLGLPMGELDLSQSKRLTASSSLRPGDQFTVKADGRTQTVTIDNNETLDTLAQKIRRASNFEAKVTIGSSDGVRKLTITPVNTGAVIEFGAGKTDHNALSLLGIPEGVVRNSVVTDKGSIPADRKGQIYGLTLASDLNLDNDINVSHASAELLGAMGAIRKAYKDLVTAATPKSELLAAEAAQAKASGKVPAYLTSQISNYQAALNRLTGGG